MTESPPTRRKAWPTLILRLLIPILVALAAMAGYFGVERRLQILKPDRIVGITDLPGVSGGIFGPGCNIPPEDSQHRPKGTRRLAPLVLLDQLPDEQKHSLLLGSRSVSSVIAGGNGEMLVVSPDNGLLLLDERGNTIGRGWQPVAHGSVESAALVPNVGLVLCAASAPAKLLVFSSIRHWQDLVDVFKSRS